MLVDAPAEFGSRFFGLAETGDQACRISPDADRKRPDSGAFSR